MAGRTVGLTPLKIYFESYVGLLQKLVHGSHLEILNLLIMSIPQPDTLGEDVRSRLAVPSLSAWGGLLAVLRPWQGGFPTTGRCPERCPLTAE